MKNSDIHGWKNVFSFTLTQTLKSKAYIISNIIFLLLVLISMPVITMFTSKGTEEADTVNPIQKVYVNNETTLPDMDFSKVRDNSLMSHITFETMQEDYDTVADRIEATEQDSVILTITEDQGMYSLAFAKASKGPVGDLSLSQLGEAVAADFKSIRITSLGITDEQASMLQAPIEAAVSKTDVEGNVVTKVDTSISSAEYWFIYGILFVVLMVNSMASSQIATSIVTEKSTRVIEYLLTSVKPLALMVGKVLAMLVAVLVQMGAMVVMMFVSNFISAKLSGGNGQSLLSQYLPSDIFQNLNIINIILCFILILLGFVFYATLASMAGATVSRLEEIGEGLMLFTLTNLVGAYIGIGAANVLMGAGDNAFVTFSFLFPLSAPFILPGAILVGKASFWIVAVAIVLQIVFIILLFLFVAKVFETLILHSGSTIKLKELIKLSKNVYGRRMRNEK
jgi:ABC-2 type transport system permease protein